MYNHTIGNIKFTFKNLKELMARASALKSGDQLAGIAARSEQERMAALFALSELPLAQFLNDQILENDEVSALIEKQHNKKLFLEVANWSVGDFRNWILKSSTDNAEIERLRYAFTPEMISAVAKLMRLQDLIIASKKISVITRFRNTLGLPQRFSTRLQPNHPTDDHKGIAASMIDGLLLGSGDAVIGINPATDNIDSLSSLLSMLDHLITKFQIPTQSCVLSHVTNQIEAINRGAPLDLIFQSIGGTEATNKSFGVSLDLLKEAHQAALSLKRGTLGNNLMYFETGQGSSLSANAHFQIDQQTCEVRAYAIAREFNPLLVNSVVGFIGPEYLYDGKQIIRAGLEDHFAGKMMGLPMGCDVCYTTHAQSDFDDSDNLLTLLALSGCNYIMGVPGADDIMLNYQSTSFHDALYIRDVLNLKPAPEFENWLNSFTSLESSRNKLLELLN
jgi:ethanolamine ammonia-lyase large subunit